MSNNPSRNVQPPSAGGGSDLTWLVRAVGHHRRLVLGFVLAGAFLALIASLVAGSKYTGVASVRVDPVNVSYPITVRPSDQISMQTEASTAASREIADRASSALEKKGMTGFTGDSLRDATEVTVPSGSLIMRISVTESSSDRAVAAANAMAAAYLADREETARATLKDALDRNARDLQAIKGTSDDAIRARQSLNAYRATLSGIPTSPGAIVTPSRGPLAASTPSWWKLVLGGIVLGAVLGFFAAIIRERTDPRLRHPEAVAEMVNAPVRRISDHDELFDGFAAALLSRDGSVDTANTVALLSTSEAAGHYVAGVFERIAEAESIELTRRDITLSSTGRVRGYRPIKSAVVLVDASTTTDAVQARTASDTATAVLVVTPVTTRRRLTRLLDALARESATIDVVMFADHRIEDDSRIAPRTGDASPMDTGRPALGVDDAETTPSPNGRTHVDDASRITTDDPER